MPMLCKSCRRVSGKGKKRKGGKKKCKYGKVTRGKRKGQCRKHKKSKK